MEKWYESTATCSKHGEYADFGGTVICPSCKAAAEAKVAGGQESGHDGIRDSGKMFPGRFF